IFEIADYHEEVAHAAKNLRDGKLVVLPTETVYGAAGLLANADTRKRLQSIRGESDQKPFTIHLSTCDAAPQYLGPISELGKRMMHKLWPGPVAIQFDVPADRRKEVAAKLDTPENAIYHNGTITLRCPDHIITSDVLGMVESPVVLTRAGSEAF